MARLATVREVERILQDGAVALGLTVPDIRSLYPSGQVRRSVIVECLRHLEENDLVAWHGERVRWTGPLRRGARPLGIDPEGVLEDSVHSPQVRVMRMTNLSAIVARWPASPNALVAALGIVMRTLRSHDVKPAVVGDFAMAYHGVVRPSRSVEVGVRPEEYAARAESIAAGMRQRGFDVLGGGLFGLQGILQVQLFPILHPHDREAYERCTKDWLLPDRSERARIVRADDLVLMKLRAFGLTGDAQHLQDAKELLIAQRGRLDLTYLEARVGRYGFTALWSESIEGRGASLASRP